MGKLNTIAEEIRQSLERKPTGAVSKPLARGLTIVMQRFEGNWRLALGREGVDPSAMEVEICKDAFKVPEGAWEERLTKAYIHPKTHRTINYHVVNFKWVEEVPELVH